MAKGNFLSSQSKTITPQKSYNNPVFKFLKKLRPAAVRLERKHREQKLSTTFAKIRNTAKRKLISSQSKSISPQKAYINPVFKFLKKLRPAAVRLERIYREKKFSTTFNKTRITNDRSELAAFSSVVIKNEIANSYSSEPVKPCIVSPVKPKTSVNEANDKTIELTSDNASNFQTLEDELNCTVVIEPIKYAEISIEMISKDLREVYYTVENENYPKGFEDWRLENVLALPQMQGETVKCSKSSQTPFYRKVPLELANVFNVYGISEKLPSILAVLSVDKMSTRVIDAYLTKLLENFQEKRETKQQFNHRRSSSFSSAAWRKFRLLSVTYFPYFKVDGKVSNFPFPKLAPTYSLASDTVLIAPQFACNHFYLTVYDFSSKVIHIIDSSWKFISADIRTSQVQSVLKYLLETNPHLDQQSEQWRINTVVKCTQQKDEYSCGCYVIRFVENLLMQPTLDFDFGFRNIYKSEITELRKRIVKTLLPTTKLGAEILDAISK